MTAPLMALTVWQPWASLIMIGAKPWEWRRWKAPAAYVGQQIVIHAGARRVVRDEVEELFYNLQHGESCGGLVREKALPLLAAVLTGHQLPQSAGLGTARLCAPERAIDMVAAGKIGSPFDSDRVDEAIWGWPLSEITPWSAPFALRGHQGFWRWPDATAAAASFTPTEEVPCS